MKKTAMTLAVLALGGLMSTMASAAPLSSAAGATSGIASSDIEQVRDRKGNWNNNNRNVRKYNNRRKYHAGRRYNRAPSNWRRYSSRPYGWRTRGCVIVGPVWFCP